MKNVDAKISLMHFRAPKLKKILVRIPSPMWKDTLSNRSPYVRRSGVWKGGVPSPLWDGSESIPEFIYFIFLSPNAYLGAFFCPS